VKAKRLKQKPPLKMSDLADELMRSWTANALERPVPTLLRRFGDIYLAPFGEFADGAEHFGMVRGRKTGVGGTFRFSPITSQSQTGRSGRTSLPMPAGTSLSRESRGVRLKKDSWLLLGLGPIPVRRETLLAQVSGCEARYIGQLPEEWIAKVKTKLDAGAA
jgi:hypothetical protein